MERFDVRWHGVLNLAAGVWLLFTHILSIADIPVMSGWSAYILGGYIAIFSAMTLQTQDIRIHGANAVLGLAAIASPFLFGFSEHTSVLGHFLGVGGTVVATSTWAALMSDETDGGRDERPETA